MRATGRGSTRSTSARISVLTSTGSRASGPCPTPSSSIRSPPVSSASCRAVAIGRIRSSGPCMITTGQRDRRADRFDRGQIAPSQPSRPSVQAITISGVGLQRPPGQVLDLLGRVRLREELGHEELDEVRVAAAPPVVPGCTSPSPRWRRRPDPRRGPRARGGRTRARRTGRSRTGPPPARDDGPPTCRLYVDPAGEPDQDGDVHPGGVQDRDRVLTELVVGVVAAPRSAGRTCRSPDRRR